MNKDSRRTCIHNFVVSCKSHPTAEDIFNQVRSDFPRISLGTVYRHLSDLVSEGLIRRLAMDGKPDRYDSVIPHDHMHCVDCGRIIDIDSIHCSVDNLPDNSSILFFSATAFGRCPDCTNSLKNTSTATD